MNKPLQIQLPGGTVRSMRIRRPGSKDLVYHTWIHFLSTQESDAWRRAPPLGVGTPVDFHARALELGLGLELHAPGQDNPPRRWWQEPARTLVRQAHDQGYWPRIVCLVARAGLPVSTAGGPWSAQKKHGAHRYAVHLGRFKLAGDWDAHNAVFTVITAYRRLVTPAHEQVRHAGHTIFARLQLLQLKKTHCPPLPPPCVQSVEGGSTPPTGSRP